MEKGERFAPAEGCGGGLERGSELEYVLKSGARKAVLVESSSLLHTLPLQEASGCHSPCSSAGLWHNMHRCVSAHRRGASQTIAPSPRLCTATGAAAVVVCTLPDPLPGRGLLQLLEHPGARWGCANSSWKATE